MNLPIAERLQIELHRLWKMQGVDSQHRQCRVQGAVPDAVAD